MRHKLKRIGKQKNRCIGFLLVLLVLQNVVPSFAATMEIMPQQTEQSNVSVSENKLPEISISKNELPEISISQNNIPELSVSQNELSDSTVSQNTLLGAQKSEALVHAELVMEGEQPGLYVTVENAPQNLSMLSVQYSFGGINYNETDGKIWENISDIQDENGNIRLYCYGLDEHPVTAYLAKAVNSLYIRVVCFTTDFDYEELTPFQFTHGDTYEIPKTAPAFSAEFEMGWFSYSILGHFKDFAPNVAKVCTTYSWDGLEYQYINPEWPRQWDLYNIGNKDAIAKERLENQDIVEYYEEPLVSFLDKSKDSFYLRLEITTEDNQVYYSKPVHFSRDGVQALPENLIPTVALGFNLAVVEERNDNGNAEDDDNYYAELVRYTYGQYQLTVKETITPEEVKALLPETVPVRIRFWDKDTREKYTFGDIDCKVKWKDLPSFSLADKESLVLENMAEALVIPAGTEVETALGTYLLQKPITFQSRYDSDDIRIVLKVVSEEEEPNVVLKAYNYDLVDEEGEDWNVTRKDEAMSLAFWDKPSGATSIKAYAVVDGNAQPSFELLERRDINHNQSHELYGYVDLFQPDEYPFCDYLDGTLERFSVEIEIEGGVYDNKHVSLSWPQEYDGPEEIFDPYGFDGQENNAGQDGGLDNSEGSSGNGGQRPNRPLDRDDGNKGNESPKQAENQQVQSAVSTQSETPEKVPETDKLLVENEMNPMIQNKNTEIQDPITEHKIETEKKNNSILQTDNEDPIQGDTEQQATIEREQGEFRGLPPLATAILLVGGVAVTLATGALVIGTAGTTVTTGLIGRVITTLRKIILRK